MTGDCHLRSCESGRVRLPSVTHQNRMHGLRGGAAGEVDSRCGDRWSRAGALRSHNAGRDLNRSGGLLNQLPTPLTTVASCFDCHGSSLV
jgi:hypothetical protein